jgi:signal transduction histidine kinase/CheY-like chemotaxis protein
LSGGKPPPPHQAFLSLAPATWRERQLALLVVIISFVGFLAVLPFARLPVGRVDAFIPAYEAALCINDLVTAALLYCQFARLRSRALLILAAGYLFDAEIMIPHALTFPGAFSPTGLLGAGLQTAPWLYVLWHVGFPLFVLAYALLRGTRHERLHGSARRAAAVAIVAVSLLAIGATLLTTVGQAHLPVVINDDTYVRAAASRYSPLIWLTPVLALAALWWRHRTTTLHLWLMVVMCSWLFDIILSVIAGVRRFDVGFYAGRSFGLLSASFVLVVLLLAMNRLYADLGAALSNAEARHAELARSRQEFARVQRSEALGQLVGGLAHDFNNLLTVMIGSLDLIQRDPGNAMKVTRLSYTAQEAAERGQRVTQQLLSFARRQILRPSVVDPNRLITRLEAFLQRAAGEHVQLVMLLMPGLWPVRLDTSEFEAALLNLLLNARDAMAGTGRITILTRNVVLDETAAAEIAEAKPGAYATVAVRDTGAGMSPATMARAFEPFFTTKEIGKGSGLGLSQVYGFASAAGGHVTIASTAGAGSIVTLFLPRSLEDATPDIKPAMRAAPYVGGGHEAILLVEDDAAVREMTVESLEALGYTVVVACNAEQALDVLRSSTPIDVLFSDVVMPGAMNGAELALEARRTRPGLKVLLSSGYAEAALSQQHGVPADLEVLSKPYRRDEVARKLRSVLDLQPDRQVTPHMLDGDR